MAQVQAKPGVPASRIAREPASVTSLAQPTPQSNPDPSLNGVEMTGAEAIIRSLENAGATDVFGLPAARSSRPTTR